MASFRYIYGFGSLFKLLNFQFDSFGSCSCFAKFYDCHHDLWFKYFRIMGPLFVEEKKLHTHTQFQNFCGNSVSYLEIRCVCGLLNARIVSFVCIILVYHLTSCCRRVAFLQKINQIMMVHTDVCVRPELANGTLHSTVTPYAVSISCISARIIIHANILLCTNSSRNSANLT